MRNDFPYCITVCNRVTKALVFLDYYTYIIGEEGKKTNTKVKRKKNQNNSNHNNKKLVSRYFLKKVTTERNRDLLARVFSRLAPSACVLCDDLDNQLTYYPQCSRPRKQSTSQPPSQSTHVLRTRYLGTS